jgi:hypothetical protein
LYRSLLPRRRQLYLYDDDRELLHAAAPKVGHQQRHDLDQREPANQSAGRAKFERNHIEFQQANVIRREPTGDRQRRIIFERHQIESTE